MYINLQNLLWKFKVIKEKHANSECVEAYRKANTGPTCTAKHGTYTLDFTKEADLYGQGIKK